MSQLIERAQARVREKELLKETSRELFETALSLLTGRGRTTRLGFFSWRQLGQTIESGDEGLRIILSTSSNIKRANKVKIDLEGMPTVEVTKRNSQGRDEFDCRYYGSTGQKLNLSETEEYLELLDKLQG